MRIGIFFKENAKMIAAVKFKQRVIGAGIFGIVINKLGHWQKPSLVVPLKVDKGLEVHFYGAILPLGLPICLQIKGGKNRDLMPRK